MVSGVDDLCQCKYFSERTCSRIIPSFVILRLYPLFELPSPLNLISNSPFMILSPIRTTNPFNTSLRVELSASVDPPSCGSSRAIHSVSPSCVDRRGCSNTVVINHISSRFYQQCQFKKSETARIHTEASSDRFLMSSGVVGGQ